MMGLALGLGLSADSAGAVIANELVSSSDFSDAAWGGAATKTSTTETDPFGGSTGILATAASGGQEVIQTVTDFTNLPVGPILFSFYIKEGTGAAQRCLIKQTVGGTTGYIQITWSGGVPSITTTSGVDGSGIEAAANGYYRAWFYRDRASATTNVQTAMRPAQGGTGNCTFAAPMLHAGTTPAPYQAT